MILVGAAFAWLAADLLGWNLLDTGRRSPVFLSGYGPLVAVATFSLLIGILLLLFRAYLTSFKDAVRILADAVRSHGEDLPDTADCRVTVETAGRLLDRVRENFGVSVKQAREDQERRVREITEAHRDLLTRHVFTKKMLQASRSHEVLEALLKGVREGLGFTGAVLGILDERGDLVFGSEGGGTDKEEFGFRARMKGPFWLERSGEVTPSRSLRWTARAIARRTGPFWGIGRRSWCR